MKIMDVGIHSVNILVASFLPFISRTLFDDIGGLLIVERRLLGFGTRIILHLSNDLTKFFLINFSVGFHSFPCR